VVLLANPRGVLPLRTGSGVAVVGPLADDPLAFFGCYSMPRHLGETYPDAAVSVPVTTLLSALARNWRQMARNWPGYRRR
jgi:beta-xylosidase